MGATGIVPRSLDARDAALCRCLGLVDAIEVLNGGNSPQENAFALEVAQLLGKPGVAGSDAHSHQGIGIYTTVFERDIDSEAALLRELRAGRFFPASVIHGDLQPFKLETVLTSPSLDDPPPDRR